MLAVISGPTLYQVLAVVSSSTSKCPAIFNTLWRDMQPFGTIHYIYQTLGVFYVYIDTNNNSLRKCPHGCLLVILFHTHLILFRCPYDCHLFKVETEDCVSGCSNPSLSCRWPMHVRIKSVASELFPIDFQVCARLFMLVSVSG